MIEAVQADKVRAYTVTKNPVESTMNKNSTQHIYFDINDILGKINTYTYTDEDVKIVDKKLANQIKQKFDIKLDDVYELYKRGVDLEQLNLQDMEGYKKAKTHKLFEDEIEDESVERCSNKVLEDISLRDKVTCVKKSEDDMYLNALTSHVPITINNLYECNFKGNHKKTPVNYSNQDVEQVLKLNGMENTSSNRWAADLLMMNNMEVTQSDVLKLQNMKSAVATLDLKQAGGLLGDEVLMDDSGVNYQPDYIDHITDELGMVTDEHIEKLIEEKQEINIDTLRRSIHQNAKEVLDESNRSERPELLEEQVGEVKKQILQIATKLTVEAAQKISTKMPLESSSLQEVAHALKELERNTIVDALESTGMLPTNQNVEAVSEVLDAKNTINAHFTETVHISVDTSEQATLADIQNALSNYETHATPVEKRFGETLEKVMNQIEGLLESQGIEVSPVNIDAARALISNHIDVTPEKIEDIKGIVLKLNTFLEEMTPVQAAQLIKENINPYHSTINELLTYIGNQQGESLKQNIAEAVVGMQKKHELSEVQKQGMIGLYRIIQAVTQDRQAVMGYLFRNELPLTIENLQVAAKYVKNQKGIQIVVSDQLGERESLKNPENTAKQMLESSAENSNKVSDSIKILETLALPITEENIYKLDKMSAILYPFIKEQFKREMGKFEGMNTLPESFTEKIEAVQNVNPELVKQMMKQEIPLTLNNIYWMNEMSQHPDLYGELLNQSGFLKEELPSDIDEFEEVLRLVQGQAKEDKEGAVLQGDITKYRSCKQLEEVVQLQRQRIDHEGLYQIPFIIHGETKLVNLYVYPDKEKDGVIHKESHLKAMITYNTKHLGTIKAYLELKGDQIGYRIEGEQQETLNILNEKGQSLIDRLMEMGYQTQYSEYKQPEDTEANNDSEVIIHQESTFEEIV